MVKSVGVQKNVSMWVSLERLGWGRGRNPEESRMGRGQRGRAEALYKTLGSKGERRDHMTAKNIY